jgi:hypothetical protein
MCCQWRLRSDPVHMLSKNFLATHQVDVDLWTEFLYVACRANCPSHLVCRKRAITLWLPLCGFEVPQQPGHGRFKSVMVFPGGEVGNVVFPDLCGSILRGIGIEALPRLDGLTVNQAHGKEKLPRPQARGGSTAAALTCHPGALQPRHGSRPRGAWPISTRQAHGSAPSLWPIVSQPGRPGHDHATRCIVASCGGWGGSRW